MPTKIDNHVHAAAVSFRAAFASLGARMGEEAPGLDIVHSVNRNGEASSYFRVEGRRIRVSDHDANGHFRVNEVHVLAHHATVDRAASLLAEWRDLDDTARRQRDAEARSRDAYEAPFIARYRAAERDHEREAIVRDAYPELFRPGVGKMQRAAVLYRFRGKK